MEGSRSRLPPQPTLRDQLRRIWRSVWGTGASREVSHMDEYQLRDIGLIRTEDRVERMKADPPLDDVKRF